MAAKEDEGFAREKVGGLDFAQKNSVVAGKVRSHDAADDLGDGVFEERDAGFGPAIADVERGFGFQRLVGLGEIDGDGLLMLFQDVDAEEAVLLEKRQEMAALVHADKSEEGIERDRCERVCGHTVGLRGRLIGVPRDSDNSDAGGELA